MTQYCSDDKGKVLVWANQKMGTNELTALHIAAFKGNAVAIKRIVGLGADATIQSKHGMNVVHCAAQNDKTWPVVYFCKELGLEVDEKDKDGNTPLHWACHFGAISSASYLLKWSNCINSMNYTGETPLHLATMSAIASGASRLVKLLCFHGADRNIADSKGRIPIELVTEAEEEAKYSSDSLRELRNILKEPNECMCLMVRVPIKKVNRSLKLPIWFYAMQILFQIIVQMFAVPRIPGLFNSEKSGKIAEQICTYVSLALCLASCCLFLVCVAIDPGMHKRGKRRLIELMESVDADAFCAFCEIVRSSSTRHCVICNRCVERYDHHCPWIDNCVGVRNHNYFLALLITLFLSFMESLVIYCFATSILWSQNVVKLCKTSPSERIMYDIVCDIESESIRYISIGILIVASLLMLFCFVFSAILTFVHTTNYLTAKTTNERFGGNPYQDEEESDQHRSSWWQNCVRFCKNRQVPSQAALFNQHLSQAAAESFVDTEAAIMMRDNNVTGKDTKLDIVANP